MGRTYLRTLGDCEKHSVVIQITCRACERVIYASPNQLIGIKRGRVEFLRGTYLEQIEPFMRCIGGSGHAGCGAKGARLAPLWPHEVPGLPRGVPVLQFLTADDRERRRLIRVARG